VQTDPIRVQFRMLPEGWAPPRDRLATENDSLLLLLAKAGIDAQAFSIQAGKDATERATADNLQKLILEELHHRSKNISTIVGAILRQSLCPTTSIEHGQKDLEGRLIALRRIHDLLHQASLASENLGHVIREATESYDSEDAGSFRVAGPDLTIPSGAVTTFAIMSYAPNTTIFGASSAPTGRAEIE
jgi:two-component sensor histidine kinase